MSGRPAGRLAPETAVELRLPTGSVRRFECTPAQYEELALGWLLCEGHLRPGTAGSIEIDTTAEPARVVFDPADPSHLAFPERWDPVGVPPGSPPIAGKILAGPERLRALFEEMFSRAELRGESGGIHTGGVVVGDEVFLVAEDVSRHCVFDKLVGAAVLSGLEPSDTALLLTGRISAAIARKAVQVGVPCVVTLSIPTTLAASIASEGGVTLVGRARSSRPFVYRP